MVVIWEEVNDVGREYQFVDSESELGGEFEEEIFWFRSKCAGWRHDWVVLEVGK